MRKLYLCFWLTCLLALGQGPDTIPISGPSPSAPLTVSLSNLGTPGTQRLFYWLVARYPVGFSGISGPFTIATAPTVLSGANGVIVSWTAQSGATGYDVLRTATAIPPITPTCTCSVVVNTAATSFSDIGGALGAYTFANPAPAVNTSFQMNNRDFPAARIRVGAVLQSTTGGFAFPDGTVQVSSAAMTASTLNDPGGNGIVIRNALSTTTFRTLTATAPVVAANGDGVAGNPAVSCPTCTTSAAALTSNGTLIGQGGQAMAATAAGAADTVFRVGGGGGAPAFGTVALGSAAAVSGVLPAGFGGTGLSALTANGVILGSGGGAAVTVTGAGAADTVFRVPGGGGTPAFGALALNQAAAVSGALARANGGTGDTVLQSRWSTFCSGTGTASVSLILTIWPSAACTNTAESSAQFLLVPSAGRLRNLRVLAGTAGVAAGSGIVTLRVNAGDSIVTCTVGVGTTCSDVANTAVLAAGDRVTVKVVTAPGETLANVQVAFDW